MTDPASLPAAPADRTVDLTVSWVHFGLLLVAAVAACAWGLLGWSLVVVAFVVLGMVLTPSS